MDVDFEALAYHGHRVANVVLCVDEKFLWKHMQDNAVIGQRDIARGVHGAPDIIALNVPCAMSQRDTTAAVDAANVTSGDADNGALHGHTGDTFGFFDCAAD